MPNPSDYDDRESFMTACVSTAIDEGRTRDQAVAMCSSMWENRDKKHKAMFATTHPNKIIIK